MTGHLLRLSAIALLFLVGAWLGVRYSSKTWPVTQGTMLTAGWTRENVVMPGQRGEYQVRYEYTIDGRNYNGDRFSFTGNVDTIHIVYAKSTGESHVDRLPRPEDTVTVHYAPWYPAFSTLVPGAGRMDWLYGVIALLAAGGLFAFAHLSRQPVV
jgi:hypothetical protein